MDIGDSICPVCHVGKLRERAITYTQVYEGRFVVIPNVQALVCDVCGEKVFDNIVLGRLHGLLDIDRHGLHNASSGHSRP
jgi:YgiT-type zinc finger domain-containing protein